MRELVNETWCLRMGLNLWSENSGRKKAISGGDFRSKVGTSANSYSIGSDEDVDEREYFMIFFIHRHTKRQIFNKM